MRKLTKICESAVFRHWPGQCMTEIYSGQDTRWVVKPPQFSAWRHFLCRCGMEEPKQSIIFYSAGRQRSEIGIAEVCRTKKARVERGALLLNSTFCMYRIKFHEARQKKKTTRELLAEKSLDWEFREFQSLGNLVETIPLPLPPQPKSCIFIKAEQILA